MKTQIEAINDLIADVKTFIIFTRGATIAPLESSGAFTTAQTLDGARDALVASTAVLDSTFPEGEDQVPDHFELAEERLRLLAGVNTVNGQQRETIRQLGTEVASLSKVADLAGNLVDALRGVTVPPDANQLIIQLATELNTEN